jgi:hypothetical protein
MDGPGPRLPTTAPHLHDVRAVVKLDPQRRVWHPKLSWNEIYRNIARCPGGVTVVWAQSDSNLPCPRRVKDFCRHTLEPFGWKLPGGHPAICPGLMRKVSMPAMLQYASYACRKQIGRDRAGLEPEGPVSGARCRWPAPGAPGHRGR